MIFLNTFLCLIVSAQFNISPDLDQQAREGHRCARQLKRWIAAKEYEYEYDRDQTRDRYKPFIDYTYPDCDSRGDYKSKQCKLYGRYDQKNCQCVATATSSPLYFWIYIFNF